MAKIIIEEGFGDCETCGNYGWRYVDCDELDVHLSGDTHLGEYLSLEGALVQLLERLGHEVIFRGDSDG